MTPTVSWCVFVHNDLPFLRNTLLHTSKWVDQICVLDLGSNDGTKEFCEAYLRKPDVYVRREVNTCPELGFAEAKNAVTALATMDWVFHAGANTILSFHHHDLIKWSLSQVEGDCASVETINVARYLDGSPYRMEEAMKKSAVISKERHRVLIRNGSDILSKGYIHEEPYRGEVNCFGEAMEIPVTRYHFQGWGNDLLRQQRYAWMFCRAMKEPELQKYTNRWWYDVFYPKNEQLLVERAEAYEKYKKETGLL